MTNTERIRRLEELLVTTRGELQALAARVETLEILHGGLRSDVRDLQARQDGAPTGGEAIERTGA